MDVRPRVPLCISPPDWSCVEGTLDTETGLSPLTRVRMCVEGLCLRSPSTAGVCLCLQRLWLHRDRFFGLCLATGTLVAVAYWLLLFPSEARSPLTCRVHVLCACVRTCVCVCVPPLSTMHRNTLVDSILEHGVMFVDIWAELFIVFHR